MNVRNQIRPGWTLIELLIVIVCLTALLGVLVPLFWSVFRLQSAAIAAFESLQTESTLADRFRGDVAAADPAKFAELAGEFDASPMIIIPRRDGDMVVYRLKEMDNDERAIERSELVDNGDTRVETYRVRGIESRDIYRRLGRMLTMTLAGPKRGTLTIAAALGGPSGGTTP